MSEEFTQPQAWRFNPDGFYADNYAQSTARLGIGIDYQEDDYDRHLTQFLRDLEAHDDEVRASVANAPQGEPSDAQVLAALNMYSGDAHYSNLDVFLDDDVRWMRAALRAAAGMR